MSNESNNHKELKLGLFILASYVLPVVAVIFFPAHGTELSLAPFSILTIGLPFMLG